MQEWQKYTGEYSQQFYDLKLKSGTIIYHCWPFGGNFTPVDGTGDVYIDGGRVDFFRVCQFQWEEYRRGQETKEE